MYSHNNNAVSTLSPAQKILTKSILSKQEVGIVEVADKGKVPAGAKLEHLGFWQETRF